MASRVLGVAVELAQQDYTMSITTESPRQPADDTEPAGKLGG